MILLFPLTFLTEVTQMNSSPPDGALVTKNSAGENLVFPSLDYRAQITELFRDVAESSLYKV